MGLVSLAIQTAREGDLLSADEEREHYRALIAYHLARSEWGQGYATEAAQAVVDWALAQPRVYRIWTVCDIDNARIGASPGEAGHAPRGHTQALEHTSQHQPGAS